MVGGELISALLAAGDRTQRAGCHERREPALQRDLEGTTVGGLIRREASLSIERTVKIALAIDTWHRTPSAYGGPHSRAILTY